MCVRLRNSCLEPDNAAHSDDSLDMIKLLPADLEPKKQPGSQE